MKKIFYFLLFVYYWFFSKLYSFADSWVFWNVLTEEQIRKWDIHVKDVPNIIVWAIQYLLWIAWTISVIFIIIWAYKVLFWSISWETSKWKETILAAVFWFMLSILAWVVVKFIFDNFG